MASSAQEKSASSSGGVLRSFGELSPFTYSLKTQNFPSLAESIKEKCEFHLFGAGGYKCLNKANGDGHISLYLGIEDEASLAEGWEVSTEVKLFVYTQPQDKYFTFQHGDEIKRFNSSKTKWGSGKILNHETFNDPKEGYLMDGSCSFGDEVGVNDPNEKWECISIKDMLEDGRLIWRS